jgi:hypothetical protein
VPERVLEYPQKSLKAALDLPVIPLITHKLDPALVIVTEPCESVAELTDRVTWAKVVALTLSGAVLNVAPKYPVLSMPLEVPNLMPQSLVPFVLTPANITVIRFTQLGIPVKSMLVPLVVATAVPLVMPPLTEVPVIVVPVSVVMVALPSAASTMLLLPELGFLRLVVDKVLMVGLPPGRA